MKETSEESPPQVEEEKKDKMFRTFDISEDFEEEARTIL